MSFPHSGVFAAIEATLRLPALRKLHFPGVISPNEAHRLLQFILANPTIEELKFRGYCPRLLLSSALVNILPNLTTITDERDNTHIVPSLLWHQPLHIFSSKTKITASDLRRLNATNLRLLRIIMDDAAFLAFVEGLSSTVEPFLLDRLEVHVKHASPSSKVSSLRFIRMATPNAPVSQHFVRPMDALTNRVPLLSFLERDTWDGSGSSIAVNRSENIYLPLGSLIITRRPAALPPGGILCCKSPIQAAI